MLGQCLCVHIYVYTQYHNYYVCVCVVPHSHECVIYKKIFNIFCFLFFVGTSIPSIPPPWASGNIVFECLGFPKSTPVRPAECSVANLRRPEIWKSWLLSRKYWNFDFFQMSSYVDPRHPYGAQTLEYDVSSRSGRGGMSGIDRRTTLQKNKIFDFSMIFMIFRILLPWGPLGSLGPTVCTL